MRLGARRRRVLTVAGVTVALLAFAVVAFASYGSLGLSGTPRQQLSQWVRNTSFGGTVGTLHDDNLHVRQVVAHHGSVGAVHTVCAVLEDDAQTAHGDLPTPYASLTQVLARAYTLEYAAGDDCFRGAGGSTGLVARSARQRARAEVLLDRALAMVHRLSGHSVATTTTTVPGGGGLFG